MSHSLRHPGILDRARREGRVTVDGLAVQFGVTHQTIRRDLADLTTSGALQRVHGGAILPPGASNIEYQARRRLNAAAKTAIGRACAAHIPPRTSVFLDIGTTSEAVARALMDHAGLMVVTNNLHVADILQSHPDCEVIVTGGALRRADMGLVGAQAVASIEGYRFDHVVLGCSALEGTGEMMDFDAQEVQVGQALLRRARQITLIIDHSKLQRSAPLRIAALDQVDRVITDRDLPVAMRQTCDEHGTAIQIVTPGAGR
ncbi:DeoR/GlpR family DNA-binding transcription regulator [Rhodobacteraceae bacterium KMM 6894]|nr:DeoR/GlpR family DNA-binding transcription regulator [Rhodobacteraceae bacterium KMM 6894]